MSKILVLQTESRQHIGFILFAGELSPFESDLWKGECIFTGVPKDPAVLETTLSNYLQIHKNIEFPAIIKKTENEIVIEISNLLSATINENQSGTWYPSLAANINLTGACVIPSPNK